MQQMTYHSVGVDYDAMDPFKRAATKAARTTATCLARFGMKEHEASRGESAYLVEASDHFLSHVEEGLGTKNLVADAMYALTGASHYNHIAQCTLAMIVNDMITVGALPVSAAMHLAVGESEWFEDETRCQDLISGWRDACRLARCAWGGGETPTLKGVVTPGTVVLSGSAMGILKPKSRLIRADRIQAGDLIFLFLSSGIHANGLTMARSIADRQDGFWRRLGHLFFPSLVRTRALPHGYLTMMPSAQAYGEALLTPTKIYVDLMEMCFELGVDIHYAINITGHGWRKLMRAPQPFAYVIERIPEPQPIFRFMQEHGPISDREAYANFNMGAGFALIVPKSEREKVEEAAKRTRHHALLAGYVEASSRKQVVILPKNLLTYSAETLGVR